MIENQHDEIPAEPEDVTLWEEALETPEFGCPYEDPACGGVKPGSWEWHYCDQCIRDGAIW